MLNSLSTLRACAYDLCLVQGVGRPHQSGPITSNHTRGEGEYSSNQRPAVTTVVSQETSCHICFVEYQVRQWDNRKVAKLKRSV